MQAITARRRTRRKGDATVLVDRRARQSRLVDQAHRHRRCRRRHTIDAIAAKDRRGLHGGSRRRLDRRRGVVYRHGRLRLRHAATNRYRHPRIVTQRRRVLAADLVLQAVAARRRTCRDGDEAVLVDRRARQCRLVDQAHRHRCCRRRHAVDEVFVENRRCLHGCSRRCVDRYGVRLRMQRAGDPDTRRVGGFSGGTAVGVEHVRRQTRVARCRCKAHPTGHRIHRPHTLARDLQRAAIDRQRAAGISHLQADTFRRGVGGVWVRIVLQHAARHVEDLARRAREGVVHRLRRHRPRTALRHRHRCRTGTSVRRAVGVVHRRRCVGIARDRYKAHRAVRVHLPRTLVRDL